MKNPGEGFPAAGGRYSTDKHFLAARMAGTRGNGSKKESKSSGMMKDYQKKKKLSDLFPPVGGRRGAGRQFVT